MDKRILLADHDPIAREGMANFIEKKKGLEIAGITDSTERTRNALKILKPDVLVTEDSISRSEGRTLDAEKVIEAAGEKTSSVAHLGHLEMTRIAALRVAGAKAIFSKTTKPELVLNGISEVASGETLSMPDEMQRQTWNPKMITMLRSAINTQLGKEKLTEREAQVLLLIRHGLSNKQIARQCTSPQKENGISIETVKEHIQNILRKMSVADRTQAAVQAEKALKTMGY